jgi:transposase
MDTPSSHYVRLLGLDDSWRVDAVDLRLDERRVETRLAHVGSGISCPDCGQCCGLADHAEDGRSRHLDTMQFTTELVARLPRCRCPDHGVKTIVTPWAGKHSRFTLFFEAFAVEVLLACRTVKAAAEAVLQTLTVEQRQEVQAVAADMLSAYVNASVGSGGMCTR